MNDWDDDEDDGMAMPTPCECGRVVELNDMKTCKRCGFLGCKWCVKVDIETGARLCGNCEDEVMREGPYGGSRLDPAGELS